MLKLRREQAQVFETQALQDFIRRAIAHLRAELPERVSGRNDADLAGHIRDIVARAKPFAFTTEIQIMCLLDAEILLGPRFYETDQHAWAAAILEAGGADPDLSARTLLQKACALIENRPEK